MIVTNAGARRQSELRDDICTGRAWGDVLLHQPESGVRAVAMVFEPGSRTHWHSHEGGQVIYVTYGAGRVGTSAQIASVQAGDIVFAPPGEEHWHGAEVEAVFQQLAVSIGPSHFTREVTAAEYNGASAPR